MILSIDPGTKKCGVAVLQAGSPPATVHRAVVSTPDLPSVVGALLRQHAITVVLIGNATNGKSVAAPLRALLPDDMPLHFVPEAYTTERAKRRWCAENPARTLWERLLPGCRTPSVPIDDYAAIILAEDWLTQN